MQMLERGTELCPPRIFSHLGGFIAPDSLSRAALLNSFVVRSASSSLLLSGSSLDTYHSRLAAYKVGYGDIGRTTKQTAKQ